MSRAVVGAISAAELMPPAFSPFPARRRMTASQKEGRAFENAVFRGIATPTAFQNRWIRYSDMAGTAALAQPDLFVAPLRDGGLLALELKLTLSAAAVAEGLAQLSGLYIPLLRFIFPQVPIMAALLGKYRSDRSAPEQKIFSLSALAIEELGPAPLIIHCPVPAAIGAWAHNLL